MPRLRPLAVVLALCAAAPACSQDLIGKINTRLEEQPDPAELLRQSAATIEQAPNFSAKLVHAMRITADEQTNDQQQVFDIRLVAPNRYAVELVKPSAQFWVRSDGQQSMTYLAGLERFALSDDKAGVSDFAGSALAQRLGSGFGSLVFSLLDSESVEKVIPTLADSSYLGEVTVEEQTLHHCRYSSGEMSWEAWFTTGDAPMLQRVKPDLSDIASKAPAAQQFENFQIDVSFDLRDLDAQTEIPTDAFALNPPEQAKQVEVEGLFAPPPPTSPPAAGTEGAAV